MVHLALVATCNLNQWAMDFDLNLHNVMESCRVAKAAGARFRTGPELELTGYGCEDHFLEGDTERHAWESVLAMLQSDVSDDLLIDVGMPVLHRGVRYNCRLFMLNRRLLLIRPKMCLADDGNYRETRWFTAWSRRELEEHPLPHSIRAAIGQQSVQMGHGMLMCDDASVASESCEELFAPRGPHVALSLLGCDIIANGSGSHHALRKLDVRLALIRNATSKTGGVYLYANQQGCDGGRVYYDGCASVFVNGDMVAQGSQFSVTDVEVVVATVDLDEVRSYRAAMASRSVQGATEPPIPIIHVPFHLCVNPAADSDASGSSGVVANHLALVPSAPMFPRLHIPEEEIGYGPACWCWDYLRRSGARGYFLPLSGGADSAATCAIIGIMCRLVVDAIAKERDGKVLRDARRVVGLAVDSPYVPTDSREFCQRLLHTCFMGTSNSSEETSARAARLAAEVGSYHLNINIDAIVSAVLSVFSRLTGKEPKYKMHGGTPGENLALQNIQARLRMVMSYLLAQLLPWVRGSDAGPPALPGSPPPAPADAVAEVPSALRPTSKGFLLVLGSANVDEALRGYMTKYDCSSADINPIGGIAKGDLARFLRWAGQQFPYPTLGHIVQAKPTAELEPITKDYVQSDEEDMGMSYEELGIFGRLRKVYRCGPVEMYQKLLHLWGAGSKQHAPTAAVMESDPDTLGAQQRASPTTASSSSSSSSSAAGSSSAASLSAAGASRVPLTPSAVSAKVRRFFYFYAANRHKLTTLTPSYHAESYSPEDNRFDLRPFLYNVTWSRQFAVMERMAREDDRRRQQLDAQVQTQGQAQAQAGVPNNTTQPLLSTPAPRPQPLTHPALRKFDGGQGDGLLAHRGASQL